MTEPEIVAHLQEARDFAFSDADPTECILSALVGGSAACCLSWAGTKLEPDYIFAGVDDEDGSIKVRGGFIKQVVWPKHMHRLCRPAKPLLRVTNLSFLASSL